MFFCEPLVILPESPHAPRDKVQKCMRKADAVISPHHLISGPLKEQPFLMRKVCWMSGKKSNRTKCQLKHTDYTSFFALLTNKLISVHLYRRFCFAFIFRSARFHVQMPSNGAGWIDVQRIQPERQQAYSIFSNLVYMRRACVCAHQPHLGAAYKMASTRSVFVDRKSRIARLVCVSHLISQCCISMYAYGTTRAGHKARTISSRICARAKGKPNTQTNAHNQTHTNTHRQPGACMRPRAEQIRETERPGKSVGRMALIWLQTPLRTQCFVR